MNHPGSDAVNAGAITTVLFDLDGTLLDSIRLILDSYHHALRVNGVPARSDDYWLAGIGTPLRVQFRDWALEPALFDRLWEKSLSLAGGGS